VAQRQRDGEIVVRDVPPPALRPQWVLVGNRFSLISAGTERSKIALREKNLLQKARARPDLARKVIQQARDDGISATAAVVRDRLSLLSPLGYSSAGVVLEVGAGAEAVRPGDRVACGGAGWANHAEIVAVPRNLVARVPDNVQLADAAYSTIGAIALHAIRQCDARVAERVGVIGLGLVGQLTLRLLSAAGCFPFGIDPDAAAVLRARDSGFSAFAPDDTRVQSMVAAASDGTGVDAVVVTAAASSADPVELAARLARDRGRIIVVGDVPVAADRSLLYAKELEIRLSRSYGPGRYDRDYEDRGRDLPLAYVRWTEQRNLEAFLALLATGKIEVADLTTHRFPVASATEAYDAIKVSGEGRAFGVLLEYEGVGDNDARPERASTGVPRSAGGRPRAKGPRVALIGAGNFARAKLIPSLREEGAGLAAVFTSSGLTAADVAARYGFERVAASAHEILEDDDVDAVVIATRHGTHAELAAAALAAGKAVFVEKPLALDEEQLRGVEATLTESSILMVGFNRRFAPMTQRLCNAFNGIDERVIVARVNAGYLASDHWLHDPSDGGGRIIGEGCHFIDLLGFLAGSAFDEIHGVAIERPGSPIHTSDNVAGTIRFRGPAVATLVYSGGGDSRLSKERIEMFGGGVAAVLDDFRRLEIYRGGKRRVMKARLDKGIQAEVRHFLAVVAGRTERISNASYIASSRATLAFAESLRTARPVRVT